MRKVRFTAHQIIAVLLRFTGLNMAEFDIIIFTTIQ